MKRVFIIFLFSLLFVASVVVIKNSYREGQETALVYGTDYPETPALENEEKVFARSHLALDYQNMPTDPSKERTLDEYYSNRAFHGAPPSIPHVVSDERSMGGKSCLSCHENGGFVKKFDAYAPVAPHPEMKNCRQCHVPQLDKSLFKQSEFPKLSAPNIHNKALQSSPPIIPHQLQMHENCLSCHAGPSAPVEIRVSHPERVNCRQCHALNNKEMFDIGDFTR